MLVVVRTEGSPGGRGRAHSIRWITLQNSANTRYTFLINGVRSLRVTASVERSVDLEEQIKFYWREVGEDIPKAIARLIVEKYAAAVLFSQDRYREFYKGRSAPGHVRRDDIECDLLHLAKQYPDHIIVDERPNKTRSSNHVELCTPNKTVITTVSKTSSSSKGPRQAVYRNMLQMVLALPAFSYLQQPEGTSLYAPIFHGAKSASSERPDFVYVVFAAGQGHYIPAINLLERYPDVLAPRAEVQQVMVDENGGQPKLRVMPRRDEEEDRV